MEWAKGQLKQVPVKSEPAREVKRESVFESPAIRSVPQEINPPVPTKPNQRLWIYAGVLGLLACAVIGVAAWSAVKSPVFASILGVPAPTQENLWAQVEIAKPVVAPIDVSVFAEPQAAVTATPSPFDESTALPTAVSPLAPTDPVSESASPTVPEPASEPAVTETPGTLSMEIVADTPTSEYVPLPTSPAPKPAVASSDGTRWIDVDLTNQRVYAYEGDTAVNSFLVSTGTWLTPTVTGQYKVYIKYRYANMTGPGYFLPDVPYVMYFYGSYGIHGTYWHNNFGTPISHGCVNLSIPDSEWLFNWSSVGTLVNVHY